MHASPKLPLALLICLVTVAVPLKSQGTVHYPDANTPPTVATPGGWFPWFTNTTGVRYQIRIPASAFATLTLPINLDSIGFVLGTTVTGAPATYSQFRINLGPSATPALTNSFSTNLVPGTETLVADLSGTTIAAQAAAGVWYDVTFTAPYAYAGGDLILDVQSQIPTGGTYLRSGVSTLVPRLSNNAYTGTQTTGTLGATNGVKVRFGWSLSGPPEYQVNTAGAGLTINGVLGNSGIPAQPTLTVGSAVSAFATGGSVGFPWEVGISLLPLVPRSAGALVTADNELVNVDITDPNLFLLWNFFQSPPFAPLSLGYPTGAPSVVSLQLIIIDPTVVSGVRCSQPSRVTVQ